MLALLRPLIPMSAPPTCLMALNKIEWFVLCVPRVCVAAGRPPVPSLLSSRRVLRCTIAARLFPYVLACCMLNYGLICSLPVNLLFLLADALCI